MDKKTITRIILAVAIFLIVCLAVGGYLWWQSVNRKSPGSGNTIDTSQVTKGLLPSLPDVKTNPLENKPDLNPVDKANPIKNIKTNPFE